MIEILREINSLDLELWVFATELISKRLKWHHSFVEYLRHSGNSAEAKLASNFMTQSDFSCFKVPHSFNEPHPVSMTLSRQLGLFRPIGHKGPL